MKKMKEHLVPRDGRITVSWMLPPKYRPPSELSATHRKCRGVKATLSALILFVCVLMLW